MLKNIDLVWIIKLRDRKKEYGPVDEAMAQWKEWQDNNSILFTPRCLTEGSIIGGVRVMTFIDSQGNTLWFVYYWAFGY